MVTALFFLCAPIKYLAARGIAAEGSDSTLSSTNESGIVILGQPCDHPYVVAIPTQNLVTLETVHSYIPTAFFTDSGRGRFIQAGSASRRLDAESLSQQLRAKGFDARVIYRPARCPST